MWLPSSIISFLALCTDALTSLVCPSRNNTARYEHTKGAHSPSEKKNYVAIFPWGLSAYYKPYQLHRRNELIQLPFDMQT